MSLVNRKSPIVMNHGCTLARIRWLDCSLRRYSGNYALSSIARCTYHRRLWPRTRQCTRDRCHRRWLLFSLQLVDRPPPAALVRLARRTRITHHPTIAARNTALHRFRYETHLDCCCFDQVPSELNQYTITKRLRHLASLSNCNTTSYAQSVFSRYIHGNNHVRNSLGS